MKSAKRKGTRNEHRSRLLLEAAGYAVTRAAASLGAWDLIQLGVSPTFAPTPCDAGALGQMVSERSRGVADGAQTDPKRPLQTSALTEPPTRSTACSYSSISPLSPRIVS